MVCRVVQVTDQSLKYVWHHEPSARVLALYVGKGQVRHLVGHMGDACWQISHKQ
jgi:hypothetical protein